MLLAKNVFISGAASGIGRRLALDLATDYQCKVWACDLDKEKLDQLVLDGAKYSGEIIPMSFDVCDLAALNQFMKDFYKKTAKLDIWVNNAGISQTGNFNELSAEEFSRVMDVNFKAVVQGTKIALNQMRAQGSGSIVNLGSVAGHVASPYMSAYVASKHAVVGFTRALQAELELEDSMIHLMLVSPGFVRTEIIKEGQHMGFPPWLSWMLSKPETVSKEIIKGLLNRSAEVNPTVNGQLIRAAHKFFPRQTTRSAKLLLAKSFKDVLLNRYET